MGVWAGRKTKSPPTSGVGGRSSTPSTGTPGQDEADTLPGGELKAEGRGELEPPVQLPLRPNQVHDLGENVHVDPTDLA